MAELVVGAPGQFAVEVDGRIVARREAGLLARLFGGGWPAPAAVIAAIRSQEDAAGSRS